MKKLLYILLFVPLGLFGQENYSLSFDDADKIDLGNYPILTQPQQASILAKVKMNQLTGHLDKQTVFLRTCLGGIIDLGYDEDSLSFYFAVHISGHPDWKKVYCSASLQYHTIIGIYDRINSEIKIYKDGVLSDSLAIPDSDLSTISCNSYLCGDDANKTPYANVDEVIVWERILSDEIIQNFTNCSNMSEQNDLVGYWNFNEGSGDTVYDISGNGNNGVINGATYSENVPNCIEGCTEGSAFNYNPDAVTDDGSCEYSGCKNLDALNYNETATIDDEESCIYSQEYVHGLWNEVDDGAIEFNEAIESLSSIQQALDTWNTTIDLSAGWNMFGYGCPSSIDVADGLSNHTESIIITKDNNGNVYMPEFGFNGIGDFTPGFGYQIKLTEAIEGFSLCDWYVNDIPEDNIVSLQDSIDILNSGILDLECVNQGACSFNIALNQCEFAQEGYDCSGEFILEIGDKAHGGIVFFIDETGEHGLVAAENDLYGFSWGCYQTDVPADSYSNGFENTIIMYEHCGEFIQPFGYQNIAYYLYNNPINGFNDWYVPSFDELDLVYNLASPNFYLCSEDLSSPSIINDYNFTHHYNYGTSTESTSHNFKVRGFYNGSEGHTDKFNTDIMYRPIRSF